MYRDQPVNAPIIVVGLSGTVFGIDAQSGEPRWIQELDHYQGSVELLVGPQYVLAASGTVLCCLEYPSGRMLWHAALTARGGRPTMIVDGDRILVGNLGELDCFSLTGTKLWNQRFKGKGTGSLAIGVPGNCRQADSER